VVLESGDVRFMALLLVSITVALLSAPASWNAYDIGFFIDWVDVADHYGIFGVYKYALKAAYPPIPILIWVPLFKAGVSLSILLLGYPNYGIVRMIAKIPVILSIYATAYILYKYFGRDSALFYLLYYGVYGIIAGFQFDTIAVLGLLMAYIYVVRDRPWLAGLSSTLAFLSKHALAVVFPYLLIVYWRRRGFRQALKFFLATVVPCLVIVAPFLLYDPYSFIYKVLFFHSRRYPQLLSIYAIPLFLTRYRYWLLPSYITWVWVVPYALTYLLLLAMLFRARCNSDCVLLGCMSLVITIVLLNKIGNTNYQLWFAPFLAIFVARYSSGRSLKLLYVLLPILTILFHDYLTLYSAAVVHGKYFITEDLRYYDAEKLVLESFRDAPAYADIRILLTFSRTYMYGVHMFFYENIWLTRTILTIFYIGSLTLFQYKIMNIMRTRCSLSLKWIREIIHWYGRRVP